MRSNLLVAPCLFFLTLTSCANLTPNPNVGERTAGMMYAQEKFEEMVEWMKPSANSGDPWAMNRMGQAYELGKGVPQDFQKAMEWYCKTVGLGENTPYAKGEEPSFGKPGHFSKNGHVAAAQTRVGTMYAVGKGRPVDFSEAFKWYSYVKSTYGNIVLFGVPLERQYKYVEKELSPEEIDEIEKSIINWEPACRKG